MNYPTEITGWKNVLQGKWVIFDSDAIVSILANKQQYVFDQLKSVCTGFLYIHPVLLELMNTNSSLEKLSRTKLLIDFDFVKLPLTKSEIDFATQIQESLPLNCQPSPTDLYLGGSTAHYANGNTFLITANIKDFPMPIYTREGHIILQTDNSLKVLTILSVNKQELV